jgi:hypothetical protein
MTIIGKGTGEVFGTIQEQFTCFFFSSRFHLYDGNGQLIFIVKGPYCTCACGGEIDFKVG